MTTTYTTHFRAAKPDFTTAPWHDTLNSALDRLDAAVYSVAVAGSVTGVWANSTAYAVGARLIDTTDNAIWQCVVSHTSAASPTSFSTDRAAHPTYWALLGSTDPLEAANNLSDLDDIPTAVANLGLEIGVDVMAYSARIAALDSATPTITLADNGAGIGPVLILYRNSASPLAGDILGSVSMYGKDSGANDTIYASMTTVITDPTDGSEDGRLSLGTTIAGAFAERVWVGAGLVSGTGNTDTGVNTINASEYYKAGVIFGNASMATIGTSGDTVPKLNATGNTWARQNIFGGSTDAVPVLLQYTDSGASIGPALQLWRNSASPTTGDEIGSLQYVGMDSAGNVQLYTSITTVIDDATSASEDASIYFRTIVAGTSATRAILANGLMVGSPTGGDKGLGTINAVAVYDDNTLLSCYVFDQAVIGQIDMDKWDALVPDRVLPKTTSSAVITKTITVPDGVDARGRPKSKEIKIHELEEFTVSEETVEHRVHEGARKFAARIGTKYDPLTLKGYSRHWKEKGHLTSMPNETKFNPTTNLSTGEWVQRLVETVEIQAVLLDQLDTRLSILETP